MGERVLNCIVLKRDEITNRPLMQFYGKFKLGTRLRVVIFGKAKKKFSTLCPNVLLTISTSNPIMVSCV